MKPNSFNVRRTQSQPTADVVDRSQRDKLIAVVRRFLNEDITAFDFDEQLDEFRDSPDSAVRFVTQAVWCHYDDCDNHLVALTKPEWDYFQRLLLLLESDRGVQTLNSRHWSITQPIALIALLGFIGLAFHIGWGSQLLIASIPFGIISIGISRFRRATTETGPYDVIIYPFATFSGLQSTHETVIFSKSRYPRRIQSRQIRSPMVNAVYHFQFYIAWLVLSPIALVFQLFPITETQSRVVAT